MVAGAVTLDAEDEVAAATQEVEEDAAAGAVTEEEAPAAPAAKRIAKPRRRESITGWNLLSPNLYREATESAVAQPRKRGRPKKRQIDILGDTDVESTKKRRRVPPPTKASTPLESRLTRSSARASARSTRSGQNF